MMQAADYLEDAEDLANQVLADPSASEETKLSAASLLANLQEYWDSQ